MPPDPRAEITIGESVKLMVINGLGFSSRPLYLESQFFESKAVDRLLGRKVKTDKITDDRLGRCLDRCYENGCNQIFAKVATKAAFRYNVNRKFRHLDTSSMNVNGKYAEEDGIGLINFGYSKDHRPDLKQFMISLISSNDGDVPLLAQTIPGNTSDKTHFHDILKTLKSQIDPNESAYYVADSALYTEKTIQEISNEIMWVTRVPEVIKSTKDVIRKISSDNMKAIGNGYHISELGNVYGKVKQRWIVVFSEQAYSREVKTFNRRIAKELDLKTKELKALKKHPFCCLKDAKAAISLFEKKLKFHRCKNILIKEKSNKRKKTKENNEILDVFYTITASLEKNENEINKKMEEKGKFIIATNELNENKLSSESILETYKGQQCVERGFRFLKDPMFMTSSVFFKETRKNNGP